MALSLSDPTPDPTPDPKAAFVAARDVGAPFDLADQPIDLTKRRLAEQLTQARTVAVAVDSSSSRHQPSALPLSRLCTTPTPPACAQTLRLTLGGSGISGLRAAGADVLRAGQMWSTGGARLASALREPSLLLGTPVALLRGPAGLRVDRSITGLALAHSAYSAYSAYSACPGTTGPAH